MSARIKARVTNVSNNGRGAKNKLGDGFRIRHPGAARALRYRYRSPSCLPGR